MRTGSDRIILSFPALISAGTEKTFIFATIKLLSRKHRKQHHRIAPTDWRLIHFPRYKPTKPFISGQFIQLPLSPHNFRRFFHALQKLKLRVFAPRISNHLIWLRFSEPIPVTTKKFSGRKLFRTRVPSATLRTTDTAFDRD